MKKYIIAFSISVLIIVLITFTYFLITWNKSKELSLQPTNIVSNPISNSTVLNQNNNGSLAIQFNYQQPTIRIDKKYNDQVIQFTSRSMDHSLQVKTLDPSNIKIEGNGFVVLFFGVGESSSTNGQVFTTNKAIESSFKSQIYRIDEPKDDSNLFLQDYNLNKFSNIEYYTDRYNVGCFNQFSNDKYCGVNVIKLDENKNGIPFEVGIYCLTNDRAMDKNCDEIIKNLEYKYL